MAEEFNSRISNEALAKFSKDVSRLEALEARREALAKKALSLEEEIGKVRLGYLKKYLDTYSEKLDDIVARKTSDIGDAFLVLEKIVKDSTTAATSEIDKAKKAAKDAGNGGNGGNTSPPSGSGSGNSGNGGQKVTPTVEENSQMLSDEKRKSADKYTSQADFADRAADLVKTIRDEETRILALVGSRESIEEIRNRRHEESYERQEKLVDSIKKSEIELYLMREKDAEEQKNLLTELRLSRRNEALEAEKAAQEFMNGLTAKIEYEGQSSEEAADVYARTANATEDTKSMKELEEQKAKYRAELEYKARAAAQGKLTKQAAADIIKQSNEKFKLDQKALDKLTESRLKKEAEISKAARERAGQEALDTLTKTGAKWSERKDAFTKLTTDQETGETSKKAVALVAAKLVSDFAKQLENKIDEIALHKGAVDTRLHGSSNKKYAGSYWDQLVRDMTSVGAVNPYFKQADFAKNIEDLVDKGIAFDLKQRAFLMTIQNKIATTFEVADGTMLRLIRIQQEDSTAGRLGMEAALNSFLNNMYENTEYLKQVADGVRGSLEEMQSLMQGAEAAEVEYQVQKWLGSLYSVGMSQSAVQGISDTLGKIAAGQIEGLTSGGASNLLIMAANDAGIPIADILTKGINADDTNKLLQAAVNYLADLAESSKDNNVVQQQLANVFGVKASDLKAATNLVLPGSTNTVFGNSLTYEGMLGQLAAMAGSMGSRTSIAEMMTNFWENGQYTLAGSMASNPVSYFIYKMAKVVDDAAGGIDLPFINVMGFGVDLNTTVSDLMRVAAVGAGILGSIGPMISGLGSSFDGRAMLEKLGIGSGTGLAITPRGDGGGIGSPVGGGGQTLSGSGYIGNSSGSDIKDSTIQESKDSKKQQMIEAKEEEEANQVNVLNTTVLKIYELLDDVAHGSGSFKVKVEGYGLTKASSKSAGALGGVDGLSNHSAGGSSGNNGSGISSASGGGSSSSYEGGYSGGSANSGGVSGSVSFGGWTTL